MNVFDKQKKALHKTINTTDNGHSYHRRSGKYGGSVAIEKKKKSIKNRSGLLILIGVALIAIAFFGWRLWQNRQKINAIVENIETEPYHRQTLFANVYGTGTIEPAQTAFLTWSTNGVVGDVFVSVGSIVKKDQPLIALDPDSLSVEILQAENDLINAQNALDDLHDNWGSDLAQAKLDLLNAQEMLDKMDRQREIMNYQRCSSERIEDYETLRDLAEELYQRIPSGYTLQAINTAQANLNYCLADYSDEEIAEAELQLELAESKVDVLQDRVNVLTDGPDPDRVKILETQLAMAKLRLDLPNLEAPFNGTVTVLPVKVGDVVQIGTQAIRIDDLSQLFLDVQVSEVDIPFVKEGQVADLVFDAYYEDTFQGEVIEISPVGNVFQGMVEYSVRIRLQDVDERIKPGMTASVNIVVDEKVDVFVVPNAAIVSLDGQVKVFVKRNGTYEAVNVALGSYSDYYSEVIEAEIAEGELVALNPPEEITGEMRFGFGQPPGHNRFGE
jgi:HlyD family secretion protein